ncbi:Sar s 3 allergen (serine protease-like protein 12) [Sarcoptes scabiei]|uniref:Sar s 3 allergen (Serine protease-like protein 12) n=1 Tax=Sarcoptes scabiei TaxID=52283 RepID=A0A132ALC0_SARSC|nr:Sar s 3 allergen (serine protease-like protein 12) [Sarcoptes scabiei]
MFSKRYQLILSLSLFLLSIFFLPTFAIVGGREVDITEVPYTVHLIVDGRMFCGGSILSEWYILTSAQFVYEFIKDPSKIEIYYGSKKFSKGTKVTGANVTLIRYDPLTQANNLAVVGTAEKIILNNSTSKAVNLPGVEYDPIPSTTVLVSGWGETEESKNESNLMAANFTVWDRTECQKQYTTHISFEEFCAGNATTRIGYGDSGDPAVQNDLLVGSVSYADGAKPEAPTVFTKIGAFVLTIQNIMAGKHPKN